MKHHVRSVILLAAVAAFAGAAHAEEEYDIQLRNMISQASGAIRGELLKVTSGAKAVAEGLAAYRRERKLQQDAQQTKETLKQPEAICQTIMSQDALAENQSNASRRVVDTHRRVMTASQSNTGTQRALESSYTRTGLSYCTAAEERQGICKASTDPAKAALAGADQDALYLFQNKSGAHTYAGTANAGQSQAVDAYIERVVHGAMPPERLRGSTAATYNTPQARAYVELQRRYSALLSMSAYSMAQIKESRTPAN